MSIRINGVEEINFIYENRPDGGGDLRLKEIYVTNNKSSKIIKKVKLNYFDKSVLDFSTLFFLTEVAFENPLIEADKQIYHLEYIDGMVPNPDGHSFGDGPDFLGFANAGGIPSKKSYLQILSTDPDFADNVNGKLPNGLVAQNGILKKITYPTGGSESFVYEPNLSTYWDSVRPEIYLKVSVKGFGNNLPVLYTTNFTSNINQEAEIFRSVIWFGAGLPPVAPSGLEPKTAFIDLVNTVDNSIQSWVVYGYQTNMLQSTAHIIAGVPYRLEIRVRENDLTFGFAAIVFKQNTPKVWTEINEELCGVRVQKIVSYDPVTNKDVSKFYTYRSLLDTIHPSAQKLYYPNYISNDYRDVLCPLGIGIHVLCKAKVFSTNSIATVEINQAAGVVYQYVIESDDSLFAHGCVQHKFDFKGELLGFPVIGGDIPDRPLNPYDFMNGKELGTIYYDNKRRKLKEITNSYSTDPRINDRQEYNYIIRKRYEPATITFPLSEESFKHYDVSEYSIYTGWDHLDATETKEFDLANNTTLTNTVYYSYENVNNINTTALRSINSEGIANRTIYKYPTDMATISPYTIMVEKNIIDPVIEEDNYKDSKLLFKTVTQYKKWNDNNKFLFPELIQKQKNNGPLETRIHFHQYDELTGNLLEVSKENDVRISYIWGYDNTIPIAEITNASYNKGVAYTSFELESNGGWLFAGSGQTALDAITGYRTYTMGQGSVDYEGEMQTDEEYIITYWKKTATGVVTLFGLPGTLLITKDGWGLYKHEFKFGTSAIKLFGQATIDELRLYPKGAFMKTFTYIPGVGISETSDINSIYKKYEYDGFNRLIRIKDWDHNILKQMEYKYGQVITPCINVDANWEATRNLRCIYASTHNNQVTITQEREELDINNCSLTYNQKRWVSTGSAGICPLEPCLEPSKRWVNGACETGVATSVISEYQGGMSWKCTFHYVWSDGYIGIEQIIYSDSPCSEITLGF